MLGIQYLSSEPEDATTGPDASPATSADAGPEGSRDATLDVTTQDTKDASLDGPAPADAADAADASPAAEAAAALGQGADCDAGAQCASGLFCVDGVCCDAECTGSCQQCNLGALKGTCSNVAQGQKAAAPHNACPVSEAGTCMQDGTCDGQGNCALTANGTSCGGGSCDSTLNQAVVGSSCDGKGSCKGATAVTCAPFKCAAGASACAKTCTANSDCVGEPCVNGSCGTVANGSPCTSAAQCTSNSCVDGYCCNSGCTGQCQACDVAPTPGTCLPVPSSQPHGNRGPCAGTSPCQGSCTGGTACTYPTVTCAAQTCTSGVESVAASCDGAGGCNTQTKVTCNGFACNLTGCFTSCASDSQCGSAPYCNIVSGSCQTTAPQGHACSATTPCATGNCVNGVCCGTASCPASDPCHAPGTCAAGSGVCTNPVAANGSGCNDGNACTQSDTCQSGVCTGANPIACPPIDICHAAGTCNPSSGACSTPPAAGANCAAGQPCLPWYPDCDKDTYGQADAGVICATTAPPAPSCAGGVYVQNNGDCCDTDSRANPGQTAWFSAEDGGTTDNCGSWDFNCNGQPELEYTNLAVCTGFSCAGIIVVLNSDGTMTCASAPPNCTGFFSANPACGTGNGQYTTACIFNGGAGSACFPFTTGEVPPIAGFPEYIFQGCH